MTWVPIGMVCYKVEKERLNMGGKKQHIMFSLVMLELSQKSVHIHVDIGTYKKLCALDTHARIMCSNLNTKLLFLPHLKKFLRYTSLPMNALLSKLVHSET